MPAPVISASSSILGWRRREPWAFQPAAINAPTSWSAVGLPAGLSINPSTGLISGSVETAGVYVVTVSATNTDGTGTMQFVIGISPEVYSTPAGTDGDYIALNIRLPQCEATVAWSDSSSGAASQPGADPAPLFTLKEGDTRMLQVRFIAQNGEVLDPECDTLKFVLKGEEPAQVILEADTFEQSGSGSAAKFLMPVTVASTGLASYLSDAEDDAGTEFDALAELEWTRSVTFNGDPLTLRASTLTFRVRIARDLADN